MNKWWNQDLKLELYVSIVKILKIGLAYGYEQKDQKDDCIPLC